MNAADGKPRKKLAQYATNHHIGSMLHFHLRRILWRTAVMAAQNPAVRAKAAETYETKVKPGAKKAWRRAKPALASAGRRAQELAAKARRRR